MEQPGTKIILIVLLMLGFFNCYSFPNTIIMAKKTVSQNIKDPVVEVLKAAMKAGGLTGVQVAEIAGTSKESYQSVISQAGRNFTLAQLHALGSHFGWEMNYIFFGEQTPLLTINKKASMKRTRASSSALFHALYFYLQPPLTFI